MISADADMKMSDLSPIFFLIFLKTMNLWFSVFLRVNIPFVPSLLPYLLESLGVIFRPLSYETPLVFYAKSLNEDLVYVI